MNRVESYLRTPAKGLWLLTLLVGISHADEVLTVRNGAEARDGVQRLEMMESWRIDEGTEEFFLGAVSQILSDEAGNIYILDRHQSQVQVVDADGRYVRTLSREGDGPGEVRRPRDMLFLPDGTLGLTASFPGKIVKITREGVPVGTIPVGGKTPEEGGLFILFIALSRHGTIIVVGDELGSDPQVVKRTRFLSTIAPDGTELARLLTDEFSQDASGFVWDEERDYFVHTGGLAMGPDGRIYAAAVRDRYEITVYTPDGRTERIIRRDFEPRKRTAAEIQVINDSRRMFRNGQEMPKSVGEYAPCVARMWVDAENRLWVAHGRSGTDQPEGVMLTWDVFDPEGRFIKQVSMACPGDPEEDRIFLLDGGRAVLVRGYTSAALAMIGARGNAAVEDEGGEVPVVEVIMYRLDPIL